MRKHKSSPRSFWSDETRVDELTQRWADGWSASRIARHLGAPSRNSVISKVHRLELPSRPTDTRNRSKARTHPNGHPWRAQQQVKTEVLKMPPKTPMNPAPIPLPTKDDKALIAAVDLEKEHCRWPVGDPREVGAFEPLFCGMKRMVGSSYCMGHHARSQNPAKPKSIKPNTDVPAMTSRILEPEFA